MPRSVIEREIPGVGQLSDGQIQAISEKLCAMLQQIPQVQWLRGYVTGDKICCVYLAANAEDVHEHARRGGFPANGVSTVRRIINPTTAASGARV